MKVELESFYYGITEVYQISVNDPNFIIDIQLIDNSYTVVAQCGTKLEPIGLGYELGCENFFLDSGKYFIKNSKLANNTNNYRFALLEINDLENLFQQLKKFRVMKAEQVIDIIASYLL